MMPSLPHSKEWLDELSFLEQKNAEIPLPAYTPHLIEVMKTVQEEHLPWMLFVEGMLIVLAANPDFIYADVYRNWLLQDEKILPSLRHTMNELADSGNAMAFPYAHALYAQQPDPETAAALAFLYLTEGDEQNARFFAEHTKGNNPVAMARLLTVYQRLEDDDKTGQMLTRLIEENAPGTEFYRSQLRVLQQKVAEKEAEEALRKNDFHAAVRTIDDLGETLLTGRLFYLRGTAQQGLGFFEASIRDLVHAIEEEFGPPEVYNDLSIAYYLTGAHEEAIQTLQEGLAKTKHDERMLYNLFVYAIQSDRTDIALEALETLRQIEITDPQIRADIDRIIAE